MSLGNFCSNCLFWKPKEINESFGVCGNPATYSWVRGQSFEPPSNFSCINHRRKEDNSMIHYLKSHGYVE